MKIVLRKEVEKRQARFVGTAEPVSPDALDTQIKGRSGYAEMLRDIHTREQLERSLIQQGVPEQAVKNILVGLERQGIISGGEIRLQAIGRERGQFELFCYRDRQHRWPFDFCCGELTRVKTGERKRLPDSELLGEDEYNVITSQDSIHGKLRAVKIDKRLARFAAPVTAGLTVRLSDDSSSWEVEGVSGRLRREDFGWVFSGIKGTEWDAAGGFLRVNFEMIQGDDQAWRNMQWNHQFRFQGNRGAFEAECSNVAVRPYRHEALEWFLRLFVERLSQSQTYLTESELEQRWLNLQDDYARVEEFGDLPFSIDQVSDRFSSDQKQYWLLHAADDLNPGSMRNRRGRNLKGFNTALVEQADPAAVVQELRIKWPKLTQAQNVIIVDPYIIRPRHFYALQWLIEYVGQNWLSLTVISQPLEELEVANGQPPLSAWKDFTRRMESKSPALKLERVEYPKKDIPHDRYWVLDTRVFSISKSIDFIKCRKQKPVCMDHTGLYEVSPQNQEPQLKAIIDHLKGETNE